VCLSNIVKAWQTGNGVSAMCHRHSQPSSLALSVRLKISEAAQIAALTYGGKLPGGYAEFREVLTSDSNGISADVWYGNQTWDGRVTVMNNTGNNSAAVAAHADRMIYAIRDSKIVQFQVEVDGVTWRENGTITTSVEPRP